MLDHLDPKDVLAALAFVISVGSLAFSVFKGRYDQIVGIKPALVFVYDDKSGWQIQNIGSGPAINIVVADWQLDSTDKSAATKKRWQLPASLGCS
jgi:hypothetical protein